MSVFKIWKVIVLRKESNFLEMKQLLILVNKMQDFRLFIKNILKVEIK